MTGWNSKKESGKVRWLGPYAPTDRHADDATLAELVRLRVENDNLKKELANVKLCSCKKRDAELDQMFAYFDDMLGQNKFNGGD